MLVRLSLATGLLACLALGDPAPVEASDRHSSVTIGVPAVEIYAPPLSIQIGSPSYYPPYYYYPPPHRHYYPAPLYYAPPRYYHHHHYRHHGYPRYYRDHYYRRDHYRRRW